METEQLLSDGEWEALLYQTPTQVKPLVQRLAVHHGHIRDDSVCPHCDQKRGNDAEHQDRT